MARKDSEYIEKSAKKRGINKRTFTYAKRHPNPLAEKGSLKNLFKNKTVKQIIWESRLEELQRIRNLILLEKKTDVSTLDNLTIVQTRDGSGFLSLPEKVRRLIIKASYYPTISYEEEILTYLLVRDATKAASRIKMNKDQTLARLIKAGHVEEQGNKFYLTNMGQIVANGALLLYPELKSAR